MRGPPRCTKRNNLYIETVYQLPHCSIIIVLLLLAFISSAKNAYQIISAGLYSAKKTLRLSVSTVTQKAVD